MPEVTLIRVEVVNSQTDNENQLAPTEESMIGSNELATQIAIDDRVDDLEAGTTKKLSQTSNISAPVDTGTTDDIPSKQNALKTAAGITNKAITIGAQGTSIYTDYIAAGYQRAGASMQAAKMNRIKTSTGSLAQVAGAALVSPYLIPVVIAMKAWQLSETNRQEIFDIKKSAFLSEIEQRNLVKDTVERRF